MVREAALIGRSAVAVGFLLVALTTVAGAQNFAQTWFRVTWEPRTSGGAPTIGGWVHNDSPFLVSDVRLHIDGLDAEQRKVGEMLVWALGDVAPGSQTYFVAPVLPGAQTYRITVTSFDVVSQAE